MLRRLLSFLRLPWSTNSHQTSKSTDTPNKIVENETEVALTVLGSQTIPETPPAANGSAESTKSTQGKKRGRKPKSQ